MLVLLRSNGLYLWNVIILYHLSFYSGYPFILNNSFVHSRKNKKTRRGSSQVSSSMVKRSMPQLQLQLLFSKLRLAFCDYLEKSHLIVCDFQYPWVAHGESVISTAYCYPPSDLSRRLRFC